MELGVRDGFLFSSKENILIINPFPRINKMEIYKSETYLVSFPPMKGTHAFLAQLYKLSWKIETMSHLISNIIVNQTPFSIIYSMVILGLF